jgi:plastocyanin
LALHRVEGSARAGQRGGRTAVLAGIALAGLFLAGQLAVLAAARGNHEVVQKGRAFQLKALDIARGDVVRFINADEFLHQIYVKSPSFNFDSFEQAPRENIDVEFTAAGTFEVRCHIHPRMLMVVRVE